MSNQGSPSVKVGCCGFPGGREDYFQRFKLVEVQQTFYKMPRLETARRWRQEAPADFEFTLKAWQLITHHAASPTYRKAGIRVPPDAEERYGFFRPSDEVHQAWEETKRFAQALEARVILFQCPPSFKETLENIANMRWFFNAVRGPGFLFVWEPRGAWSDLTIKALCAELELIHCVDPMEKETLFGEPQYFRLHGGPGYRHQYTNKELEHIEDKAIYKNTYVLFNNLDMRHDALAFASLIRGERYLSEASND
jgi:uncharacterized protein YecE (DUF72 family)